MIPVRVPADAPLHIAMEPRVLRPSHPLQEWGCAVCDEPFAELPVVLVYVGADPEQRARGGEVLRGAGVAVHAACAGIDAPATAPKETTSDLPAR